MCFDVDLERIRKIAEDYYRNGDFIVPKTVVKQLSMNFKSMFPEDVIKMASGFPVGMGGMGCTCGGSDRRSHGNWPCLWQKQGKDPKVNKAMELSAKLYQIFCERHKVSCCKVLTRGMEKGSPEHMEQCIAFTGEMAYEAAKIIAENAE